MKVDVRIAWEFPPQSRVVLATDYDALAQRCRELDIEASRLSGWLGACDRERLAAQQERDTLRAEVERLRSLLKQAAAILPRDYQDEEALARQIDKEIAAWNAPTTGDTPAA